MASSIRVRLEALEKRALRVQGFTNGFTKDITNVALRNAAISNVVIGFQGDQDTESRVEAAYGAGHGVVFVIPPNGRDDRTAECPTDPRHNALGVVRSG